MRNVGSLFVRWFSGDAVVGVVEAFQDESCQVAVRDAVDDIPALSTGVDEAGEP